MKTLFITITLIMIWTTQYAQVHNSILHPKNVNNNQMNGIVNSNEGMLIFGLNDSSLFQKDDGKWIQLRQELQVCNDNLSILSGNSVNLNNSLPLRLGETISWNGEKWFSDDLLMIQTGGFRPEKIELDDYMQQTNTQYFDDNERFVLDGSIAYLVSSQPSYNHLGVENHHGGLEIFDISTLSMSHISSIGFPQAHYPRDLVKESDYLYIACTRGPKIVDVSDPSNPVVTQTTWNSWGFNESRIAYHNGYIYYYGMHFSSFQDRLFIYEVTNNGANLNHLNTIVINGIGGEIDIDPESGNLFLVARAAFASYDSKLYAMDLSEDPINPTVFEVPLYNLPSSLLAKNDRVYIGQKASIDKILIYDVFDLSNMTLNQTLKFADLPGMHGNASFCVDDFSIYEDKYLITTTWFYGYSTPRHVIDISAPAGAIVTSGFTLSSPYGFVRNRCEQVIFRNDTIFGMGDHLTFARYKMKPGSTEKVHINNYFEGHHTLNVNGNANKINGGNWLAFSDQRVKRNIRPYSKGLEVIRNIKPYQFNYRSNSGYSDTTSTQIGVMAQEMKRILPNSVKAVNDTKGPSGLHDKLQFDSSTILWNLVNAVQEINNKQSQIEQRINSYQR